MHLTDEQLRQYRARSLSATDLLSASDHLAACEMCRKRLAALRADSRQVITQALDAPELSAHLSGEELAAYMHSSLAEEERAFAEHHLASCRMCEQDLQELRAFADSLNYARSGERRRVTTAGVQRKGQGFFSHLRAFLDRAGNKPMLIAAAAVLLLGAIIGSNMLSRNSVNQQERLANTTNPNRTSPSLSSPADTSHPAGQVVIRDGGAEIRIDSAGKIVTPSGLPEELRRPIEQLKLAWSTQPRMSNDALVATRTSDSGTSRTELQRQEAQWGGSRLIMGLLYAEQGRFQQAATEFETLLVENRDSPATARFLEDLLRAVRAKQSELPPMLR
jgi:anti-sigma factor RsiW